MPQTCTTVACVAKNGKLLSILYLRCALRLPGSGASRRNTSLSILYLRCIVISIIETQTDEAFNSLFEMHFGAIQYRRRRLIALSILYLRCLPPQWAGAIKKEKASFNSLFEMRNGPRSRGSCLSPESFNSPFEMRAQGGVSRREVLRRAFNSLFEMQDPWASWAAHPASGPFNSLFEMQNIPPTSPRPEVRTTFNSLFEMLTTWCNLNHIS